MRHFVRQGCTTDITANSVANAELYVMGEDRVRDYGTTLVGYLVRMGFEERRKSYVS